MPSHRSVRIDDFPLMCPFFQDNIGTIAACPQHGRLPSVVTPCDGSFLRTSIIVRTRTNFATMSVDSIGSMRKWTRGAVGNTREPV